MSETKLLPCPFCGGEAEVQCIHIPPKMSVMPEYNHFYCACKECGVAGKKYSIADLYYKKNYVEIEKELINKAIQAWNTRKPMDDIVKRLNDRIAIWDNAHKKHTDIGSFNTADKIAGRMDEAIECRKIVEKGGTDA